MPTAGGERKKGAILAAITALKQICNHPAAYRDDGRPLAGRSGKLSRLEEIVESVFAAGERVLVFTHFATWGRRLAEHLTEVTGVPIACYDGSLARGARDRLVSEFQNGEGPGALVLSLKAGGTGLNLTAANHVVLYDRWWNPAVEDQARDRAWRIGQDRTVISHRLVCPGTVDERVEEVVAGKRHIAQLVLPRSSSIADLNTDQLRLALGLRPEELLAEDDLMNRPNRNASDRTSAASNSRSDPSRSTSGAPPTRCPTSNRSRSPTRSARCSDRSAIRRRSVAASPPATTSTPSSNGRRRSPSRSRSAPTSSPTRRRLI